jgi:PPOX class probable F420-dependent enzyme
MYTTLEQLGDSRYISLTTYKRDGSPVKTPVWVVSDNGRRLLVWTGAKTSKVKRLRRNANVLVGASDYRGRLLDHEVRGTAQILDDSAAALVEPLLAQKYGRQRKLLRGFNRLARRKPEQSVYIEIIAG